MVNNLRILELKSNPSKEDIKQIVRDELNVWSEASKNNEKYGIYPKFRSCNFPVRCGGSTLSKKPKFGRFRNFKPDSKHPRRRSNMHNFCNQGRIGTQLKWLALLSCVVLNP